MLRNEEDTPLVIRLIAIGQITQILRRPRLSDVYQRLPVEAVILDRQDVLYSFSALHFHAPFA